MFLNAQRKKSRRSPLLFLVLLSALGLAIASISIPNLMRSRIAANEASAVGSVRTLNTALVTYSSEHPEQGYPQKLSDLSPYIDTTLASGQKSGYNFRYVPDAPDVDGVVKSFHVIAAPITNQAGSRRFSSNESGEISYQAGATEPERLLDGGTPQPREQRQPTTDRKMMSKASLNLIVSEPSAAGEKIRALAYRLGGYVESERSSDYGVGTRETSIAIRVPIDRMEEARYEVRKLGDRVKNEEDDARDVTAQHVDLESHLRNFRAEEAQYLEIMRRSGTIKDTLEVSQRLADVRGRIERTQGQLDQLAHQTEMAVLEVNLQMETVVQAQEVHWRPLAEIKAAFWSAADDLSTYTDFMITVLFKLPVFALWTATVLFSALVGWRFLRWAWRKFVPETVAVA